MSVVQGKTTDNPAVSPEFDDDALQAFEAGLWRITKRKLTATEIDLVCILHEKFVARAVQLAAREMPV